eukprot:761409_1
MATAASTITSSFAVFNGFSKSMSASQLESESEPLPDSVLESDSYPSESLSEFESESDWYPSKYVWVCQTLWSIFSTLFLPNALLYRHHWIY